MRLVLLVFACLVLGIQGSASAQCTTGCTNTITLSSSSQTISYTFSGSNETLCIVKSGSVSGNATITSGTINVSNRPNATICYGPGVVVASGVSVTNPNNQFTINNYGTIQNSLSVSSNQNVVNNYGTVSGTVNHSNGTINNMSGGTFSSSSYNFNGGSFVNNSGASFSSPVSFTIQSGASFSGAGSFSVTGNFATNNGASASIGGTASISGNVQSNAPITFSGATTIGGNLASNNGGPLTFGSSLSVGGTFQSNATVTVAGSLSVTGALSTNNGGPLTVTGATTIGGAVNTNATTTFSSTLAIGGALQINNGGPLSVTGATTITGNVQSNATTSFGSSVAIGGTLQVNNGGPITIGGTASVTGLVSINATTTISGLATLAGGLTMNNGGNTTFSSGANITGNFTNNATATFTGNLNVSGTITNNGSGTITSSSGSCKGVCATSISNNGTISSTAGPNLAVCVSPSGSGSQSNVVVSVTPTAGPTGFSTSVSGSTVSGSFTAASPAPGGYIVLRKTSAIVAADLPVSGTTYTVGSIIGGATVIATLSAATTTFSHSDGCGSFYYAVVSSSSSGGGTCGSYYTTSYATSGPVSVSCSGNRYWVSSASSNWNSTSNWSVSSGGPTGASVPSTGNLAIFDNARNGNCLVDATVDVLGIQISGYTGAISQNANPMTMRASGFSQTSGTFTGGSAAFSINTSGLFALSGGTFTSTSATSTLSGNFSSNQTLFTHSAGTFNHNNGTWVLNPSLASCANPVLSLDVSSSTSFYNLTLNGINGCGINANFGTASGDVVNVVNTLNHNDGVVSGAFSLKGNLTVGTGADAGYGTITVDGTTAQTYSSSTGRTCQLVVNKSAGSFTPSVATDLFVQSFTLSAGSFTAPAGTLNVGGQWGSSITIFGHSGGTFNHNNGTVEFNPSLISCANPTLTVDVIPSTVFNNFTVNGIAGCGINATVSTASGDVVQGDGDFVHADGIISGSFSFHGNLWIYAGADGGTGTLTANGTGGQTYYQAAGSPRTCQIVVNKPAGTFTPAIGTTDLITQGFQLTAGTFTAPSGTLNVGGPWGSNVTIFGHSGGTFNHNNGTVEFNPNLISCANPTFTVDVIPATVFYNFTVNGIAGCGINATISTASGDVIQGLNDFTHTDGIIAGSFAFQGNLIINAGADGGTGTITANGTGAQTYAQAAGSPRTCQIIVDKSAGALTPAGGTTDLITQGFQLLTGAFTAPSGTLNVGGSWGTNVTIFGHSGGTFTHNNGTVEFNPNLINCANPTFTVDVLPATLFYNFTVNGVAGCGINATVSTASGDVVQGANNFTHTDGIIAGNFAFQGNLVINAGADGGTGTITANGTGAQTYAQSAGTPRTCQIIVNKSAGAFTPAGGTTDLITQGFQLTAGTFTAPSGTLNVGGPWGSSVTIFGHSGGTFNHNNGTVEFNPNLISCANPTFTVDVIPATLFYNFTVNGIAGCGINATVSTAAGDVVQGTGDFTHTDGIIAGNFAFRGNLNINAGADGGTGTITANGTGAQTYSQAAGTPRTCQIIVNKSSGALTPAGGTTDLITQGFQLTAGTFTAPSGTLNVGGPWGSSVTIFGHSGGTFNHNNGTVEFNPNLINCANPTFTIDVIPATLLNNFVVNGIAGCGINATVSTASGDVVQGAGDFTHTDGIIAGNFAFRGNLVINTGADGGTGTITANGTGAQTYSQAAGTPRTCQIIVNKSAGALTPAVGTTDLLVQGFTLTAGSFTAPSGTMNVGGNWGSNVTIFGHTGGTFNHNNGTVEFNPSLISCANPTFTFDVINSTSLYNLTINGTAGCGINATMTSAAGDTIDVLNTLIYNDGVCNAAIEASGNVTVNSTFDGGTGRLIFDGGNAQNFDLTGANAAFDGPVVMNKPANSVTLLSPCTLDGAGQSITFTNGVLNNNSSTLLTLGNNVTSSGGSNSSFVNGIVRKIGSQAFTFPVGKGTSYAPVSITAPSVATDHFTAEYFPVNPNPSYSVSSYESSIQSISTCEYWNLERTNGTSNVSVRLSWDSPRSCAVTNILEERVARWNGSQWINQGNNGSPTGNTTTGTVLTCSAVGTWNTPGIFTLATTLVNTISYAGSPFCKSVATPQPVTLSGVTGGTYSASPAGLSINASTGDITPSTSTAGTYTVTYSFTSSVSCANISSTTTVTITALPTISYAGPFCTTNSVAQSVTRTGIAGGTYSASPAGLSINTGTGAVTPSTSSAGTYTVTYSYPASAGCAAGTVTASVTITGLPSATISYAGTPFCKSLTTGQPVTITGTTGGTFSAGGGLTISSTTGDITPSTSIANTYTVTYAFAASGGCAAVSTTTSVTITTPPSATISYAGTPFCRTVSTAQGVTRTGTPGGTYSSTAGLTISSTTGSITPSTSTAGSYTVSYTIAASAGCPAVVSTTTVVITALPTIAYAGTPFCKSLTTAQPVTQTGVTGGSYSSATSGLSINTTTGDITPSTSTAAAYTVRYAYPASAGCAAGTATTSVTVTTLPTASISYPASGVYCTSAGTQAVTLTGTSGGTYSVSPSGLTISGTTGTITPSTSTAGTYTVTYTIAASGGCPAVTATASITINAIPALPTAGNGSRCFTGTVNISATPGAGETIDWYAAASGGSVLAGGSGTTTFTTPSIAATTTYYAEARNTTTGCISSSRRAVTATVNITNPPTGVNGSGCGPGTVGLSAIPAANEVVNWYAASTGGSSLILSNTYSPANLTTTTTFYAQTTNTITGCVSQTRTPVVATINPFPSLNVSSTGAVCTGTGSLSLSYSSLLNGANEYRIDWSNAANAAGLADVSWTAIPSGSITVSGIPATVGTYSASFFVRNTTTGCQSPIGSSTLCGTAAEHSTITLTAPSGGLITAVNFASYGTPSGSCGNFVVGGCNSSTSLSVVQAACVGQNSCTVSAENSVFGDPCVGSFKQLFIEAVSDAPDFTLTVEAYPTAPSVLATGSRCGTGTVTIGATPGTGQTIDWYAASTGGSVLTGGTATSTFTTPSISTSTNYYAQARTLLAGCLAPTRAAVLATVNPLPSAPAGSGSARCGTGTLTISATPGTGETIDWYSASSGGTLLASSSLTYSTGSIASTTTYYAASRNTTTNCVSVSRTAVVATVNPFPTAPVAVNGQVCGSGTVNISATVASGVTVDWYAASTGGSALASGSTSFTTTSISTTTIYYAEARNTSTGCVSTTRTAVTANVYAYPVVAAITGPQTACTSGTTTFADATAGGVWTSSNTAIATVSSAGLVTGVSAGTTNINYTVTGTGGCQTVVSRSVTIYSTAPGTPNTFGNGVWNAYVYNASNYSSNYSGYFTTASSLSYSSTTDYLSTQPPSTAATYQGCQVNQTGYSVRFQRTNFTPGVYQIDITNNDDEMAIILNGTTIYSYGSANNGARTNVWTGTLGATSQLEFRYANSGGGPGYISFGITSVTKTASTAGTIAGDQVACNTMVPSFGLTSPVAPVRGSCSAVPTPVQWESSIDNVTFAAISGANANTYMIPTALSQTTYFRRAFRSYCDTIYSNTVTVTVYNGAQGTPNTYGNGVWNAFVYNASDYTTSYSGYYTTASALSYNSTTDFGVTAAPSTVSNYQGCQVNQNGFSIRYQRTNFTPGTYQIDIPMNDDGMNIILDGTTIYTSAGYNPSPRTNVWTGTLTATSQLEIRFNNNGGGNGQIEFVITPVTNTPPTAGTIAGNQVACNTAVPSFSLTSSVAATAGTCTLLSNPYQWESSTDNVSFATIAGANATTYTIPTALSQTTYFRRAYRTWCETVYSNTITVTVYNGAQGTPNTYGNGLWNAYVYNSTDFSTNYSGYYTTGSSLSYDYSVDYTSTQAPSLAPTYQGCQVSATSNSVRYQRTGFPLGVYQIDMSRNDDEVFILLNGVQVYTRGYNTSAAANVWTGTLGANSNLEIRYRNTGGPGEIIWTMNMITKVASSPGTIGGNQVACNTVVPSFGLTNTASATQGSCTIVPTSYQWQSSTDNVTFNNIAGANAATYTIPTALSQTTYFRRSYRTYCDTLYSNTVTVTIYNGAQGTPNTYGNGLWNAYVYNSTDFSTNYSGYYTTGSSLSYNNTGDFTSSQAPSLVPTYQGCQVSATSYSVRYQRTGFPLGVYRININRNDDEIYILLNGVQVYTRGYSTSLASNAWTGTLGANSNLEIRYRNTGGIGEIDWGITLLGSVTPSTPGTIAGNQTVCSTTTPAALTSALAGSAGSCTVVPTPIQWQSSTDNVTFTNIAGANAVGYTIPTALSQTTYFRRMYRTYCDSLVSNTITITVTPMPSASISYAGSPLCKSIGGSYAVTRTGTSGGNYSSAAGLSLNASSGAVNLTASSNGTYTVTYTIAAAGGCPVVTTNTSLTLNPDVTSPTTPSGTSTFCQGSTIGFTTSASNATGYSWSVTGTGNSISGSGTSVSAVFDPAFSGSATISVSALGCGGPTAPVSRSLTVNPNGMWLGASSNWNAAANWCGGVPTITTDVIVPTGSANMPQINGASFCNNIALQAGTSLLVNGTNNFTIAGSFTNSGTFTPASGSTVVYASSSPQTVIPASYGNLSTSGTGLKTLSGTIQISGTFTPAASSHDAGSSTVVFNGSSAQNVPAFTFYNLASSTNTVKSLTGNVTVSNDLALTNGTVSIGANSLDLDGTVSGTGTLSGTCSSSLVLNGSGSTGTLRFASGGNTLGTLAMAKSAAGDVTLGGNLDICSVLNLSQGKVILGKNNLTLLSGAVTTNQNSTSYLQTIDQNDTTGAGFFIREVANGGGMTIFPVGNASTYTPAYLDNIGFTRNFKVRVFSNIYEHGTYGDPIINLDNSVQKTWEISPTAGSGAPDVSIKLQWNLSDEGPSFPATRLSNKLYMGKNIGVGNSLWTKLVTDESDLTGEPFTITTARVTTFSKFAVGSEEQPLPVRMSNLMVTKGARMNQLSWKTYSERDSKGFEILKSTNGNDFASIGFVKAAGNSGNVMNYKFEDRSENRKVYYKIRFTGNVEGDVSFSNVVVVNPGAQPDMQAWPNPTTHQMTVSFSGMTETDVEGVELVLTSVEGKMIPTPEFRTESGQITVQTSSIPSGIYLLEARKDGISLGKIRVTKL